MSTGTVPSVLQAGAVWLLRVAAIATLLAPTPAPALDPARKTTQYVVDVWTQDHGLPQNAVNAITQTRDGYVWLGTEEGLVRFDGVRFTVFDRRTTPELRTSFVNALHEDRAGDLWIGTFGGGLVRLRKGRFELFTKAQGLPSDRIRWITEDPAGTLWVATGGGGLARHANGRFTTLTVKDGLGNDRVWSAVADARGRLFIGTYGGGLSVLEGGKLTTRSLSPSPAAALVRPTCLGADGSLWAGTDGAGLFHVAEDGAIRGLGAADGLPSLSIRALASDRDGNLWIGTDGAGLLRYRDGRFQPFTARDGLPSDGVLSLYEDREGNLWVGTSGGVVRLRDGRFLNLTTRDGLGSDMARAVLEDRTGALWVATTGGGVTRFGAGPGGAATTLRAADGLASDLVFSLHEDGDGRLWIGTDGAGVNVLENGRLRRLTTADGLVNDRVRTLCGDREGAVWLGTVSGLSRYANGRFTSFTPKDGLPGNSVRVLLPGRDGALWIGSDGGGLGRLQSGAFQRWSTGEGLSSPRVFSLHEDANGTLWVGTSGGGLNRLSRGKLRAITSANGLYDDVVFQIVEDAGGYFWMTCNRGVFRVSRDELDAFADGRLPSVTSQVFGRTDGMASAECNAGSPGGIRARDGRILIPTIKGVASIDPSALTSKAPAPSVHVEELAVDGRIVPMNGDIRLEPGTERLEVRYTATRLAVPQKARFRYRLFGFDRTWVEAGTRRSATYTNLHHGPYRFRVIAANEDGVWNEEGAALAFSMTPFVYQRSWFQALCVMAVAAAAFGLHRLRMSRLEARERELAQVVAERTVELQQRSAELQNAQEQIERLSATTSGVLEDPAAWARSAAREMAAAIGAREIGIWLIQDGALVPLSATGLPAPDWKELGAALQDGGVLSRPTGLVVPVLGMTGEARGVVVVEGPDAAWGEVPQRVIASLARHLGTALDLRVLRERLVTSEGSQLARRDELRRKGIELAAVCPLCGEVLDDTVAVCPRDQVPPDRSRLLPLRPAGRYLLRRWLGEGGMGTVFQAQDERLDREVVVKVIRSDRMRDAGALLRFEREARLVAQIRHPGVVAVFDTGELLDGSAFLVMEYLPGLSLADAVASFGRGTPAQVARLARHVGGALEAAHRAGVVHRDVKPGNVLLVPDPDGFQAKVLDFGVAKSLQTERQLTRTGIIVGTPAYMSPEQVRGEAVGARSDLYSLAAVVYEAFTGQRLVPDGDISRIFNDVLQRQPTPPSELVPGATPAIDRLFAWALAKKPEDRPPGALAWVEGIAPLLEVVAPGEVQGWPERLPDRTPRRGAWILRSSSA